MNGTRAGRTSDGEAWVCVVFSTTGYQGEGGVLFRYIGGCFIGFISLELLFLFWNIVGKDFLLTWRERRRRTMTEGAYGVNGAGVSTLGT